MDQKTQAVVDAAKAYVMDHPAFSLTPYVHDIDGNGKVSNIMPYVRGTTLDELIARRDRAEEHRIKLHRAVRDLEGLD